LDVTKAAQLVVERQRAALVASTTGVDVPVAQAIVGPGILIVLAPSSVPGLSSPM
jgi:hypothetical protein